VSGYDERLTSLAGKSPVIPVIELIGTVQKGRIGLTGSYVGFITYFGAFVSLSD
jgi:hypothetical protein